MMDATTRLVLQGLGRMRGDDLVRAQRAFRNLTPQDMQQQHGESGMTRQQVLDGYQQHSDQIDAAIKEVERLSR